MQKPKASRVPASGKPSAKYSRGKLGKPLNLSFAEFDLTDSSCGDYNCFHDPMLKNFFRQPKKKKQLLKQGLVTEDDKVLCSLREFNQYRKYIKLIQQNWNKLLLREQKQLLKEFILLQMEGKIPENVSFAYMTELLISESKSSFRTLFKKMLRPGETLHDVELEWERTQRLQLEELRKEIIRDLRVEGRVYQVPVRASKLGAAMSTQPSPHAPASAPKGLTFSNTAEQVANKMQKGAGDMVMTVKDLQHSEHKPVMATEERESGSSHSKVAEKLVSSVLWKIQDSNSSDFSPSEPSFDEPSKVQNLSCSCASSQMNSPTSLDSEALTVSPTSEVAKELVSSVLRKTEDSPSSDLLIMDLEMSSESLQASPVESCSDAEKVSPTSEVADDLISGVLREIQESPSLDRNLPVMRPHESSELQSFSELKGTVESPNHLKSLVLERRWSSPASYESSELTLTDLKMLSDSRVESPTSSLSGLGSNTETDSFASEIAMDIVKAILRNIQELPQEPQSIPSSESQSFAVMGWIQSSPEGIVSSNATLMDPESLMSSDLDAQMVSPTSEAAMDLVSDVLRKTEDSPCSDVSLLESAPTSTDTPTLTNTHNSTSKKKNSNGRSQIFTFLSRSWELVRQMFTNASRSSRVHVL